MRLLTLTEKRFAFFALFVCLLCRVPLSANAQCVIPTGSNAKPSCLPNGQGKLMDIAATSYIVDRSPWASSAIVQQQAFDHVFDRITGSINVPNTELLTTNIKNIRDFFSAPPTSGQDRDLEEFKQYLMQTQFNELSLNKRLDAILGSSITYLNKAKEDKTVLAREKKRNLAAFAYLLAQSVRAKDPARTSAFALDQQSRWYDKKNAFATNLVYSNSALRTDFIGQYLTGTNNGYGAALRFALDEYKSPPNPRKDVISRLPHYIKPGAFASKKEIDAEIVSQLLTEDIAANKLDDITQAARDSISNASQTAGAFLLRPHYGLTADYQHLNLLGDYYAFGVSASALRPTFFGKKPNALFFSAGLRYQWFDAESSSGAVSKQDFGGEVTLAWQDNRPHPTVLKTVDADGNSLEIPATDLGRWHTRAGFEYRPYTALVLHDEASLFVRLRDRQSGEYTFRVGTELNGQAFYGFDVSFYFGGKKQVTAPKSPAPF